MKCDGCNSFGIWQQCNNIMPNKSRLSWKAYLSRFRLPHPPAQNLRKNTRLYRLLLLILSQKNMYMAYKA